jgi:hypothetical protein
LSEFTTQLGSENLDSETHSKRQLIVAIATGQAVANLPPILHLMQGVPEGQSPDVCWLCTNPQTQESAQKVAEVLSKRGICSHIQGQADWVPDALKNVASWWQDQRERFPFLGAAITLVINGGTKPLALALVQAMTDAGDMQEVVYAPGQPVSMVRMPGGRMQSARVETLQGSALTLGDLLHCAKHQLFDGRTAQQRSLLWDSNQGAVSPPNANLGSFVDGCTFRDATGHLHHTVLGAEFEFVVGQRVLWNLLSKPEWQAVVAELWTSVLVCRPNRPVDKTADWDVLIVLRNGVLINIECKSGLARPDVNARWHTMHEAATSLATMWLCCPLPTALADQGDFFDSLRGHRETAASLNRPHLAWTFPYQPSNYRFKGTQYHLPTFEEQLDGLMAPYLPA